MIVEGKDPHGDGVDIATRSQQLAEPGGIVISGTAYDQLKSKIDAGYEFLGERQVKNIASPVSIYKVPQYLNLLMASPDSRHREPCCRRSRGSTTHSPAALRSPTLS